MLYISVLKVQPKSLSYLIDGFHNLYLLYSLKYSSLTPYYLLIVHLGFYFPISGLCFYADFFLLEML